MTAFILSSAIAFSLYQLLAFTKWPPTRTSFHFYGSTLTFTEKTANTAINVIRVLIVAALLLFILTIHDFASPADVLEKYAKYEINIVFGFVFGPLAAIWVNSVVLHNANDALTAGQILSVIALALLFILGATGNETSKLISNYAHHLSSVKVAGAELSFTSKEPSNRDRLSSTGVPGSGESGSDNSGSNASGGLFNLSVLAFIIDHDSQYLTTLFLPKGSPNSAVDDLTKAHDFVNKSVGPPLSCLYGWYQQTGDSGPVNKYLMQYAALFRQLEALNQQASAPEDAKDPAGRRAQEAQRMKEITVDFVHTGLTMALDIALSTAQSAVLDQCHDWFQLYSCPPEQPTSADNPIGPVPQCLRDRLAQFASSPQGPSTGEVGERINELTNGLADFVKPSANVKGEQRGLEALPYFALARASLMSQLDQHEAAAAILHDWLQKRNKAEADLIPQIKEEWLTLRARSMLATYVEEWLDDGEATPTTIVQTKHLDNLRITRDGLKRRLLKADFFQRIDASCQTKCELTLKRPADCETMESPERLKLLRSLYSSYATMEYTYVHRALAHPDYREQFAETTNEEARRLISLDMSCGARDTGQEAVYAQSLLGFAENAVSYAIVRSEKDDEDTQKNRLGEAEHVVKFALEVIDQKAREDQERGTKSFLELIKPTFAVQTQELLKKQLVKIQQTRKQLDLE